MIIFFIVELLVIMLVTYFLGEYIFLWRAHRKITFQKCDVVEKSDFESFKVEYSKNKWFRVYELPRTFLTNTPGTGIFNRIFYRINYTGRVFNFFDFIRVVMFMKKKEKSKKVLFLSVKDLREIRDYQEKKGIKHEQI